MIVTNTSPLIALGKTGNLYLLRSLFRTVLIPEGVYKEISEKKETPEAAALNKAIKEKWIFVKKVSINKLLETKKMGDGEKEAISLSMAENLMLLADDNSAKAYSRLMGVESHGTLFVLFAALKKKLISKNEGKEILEELINNGFYISTDVYSGFISLLESI